ncbi:MAG: NAD(P)/FAD-dependent oxidoreductase [Candidatus Izemoplasmatales bacterium]
MFYTDTIIIGGGASGLMSAISASNSGCKVILLEKNNRIGKKILVTGNGRCNYTNILLTKNDYNHPFYVEKVFEGFGTQNTIDLFESFGIVPKVENDGKTFPLSEQASSFLDVFLYELSLRKNIEVFLNKEVIKIQKNKDGFYVRTFDNNIYSAKTVILCAGGKSMPLTGSDGSGYSLVENLGHSISAVFPALVKLKVDSPYLKQLSGVKINSQIDLMVNDRIYQSEYGDILFTNYGISGPTVLELSRKANEFLNKNVSPILRVIIIQEISKSKIIERMENFADREVSQALIGLVNKRLISVLIKEAGIAKTNTLVRDIEPKNLYKLIDLMYDWRFKVIGSLGFDDSQVTAGGVNVNEINNETLESLIIPGLFFAGEVMDIDGRCGGYNLQWAWSSGYIAGRSAASRCQGN